MTALEKAIYARKVYDSCVTRDQREVAERLILNLRKQYEPLSDDWRLFFNMQRDIMLEKLEEFRNESTL